MNITWVALLLCCTAVNLPAVEKLNLKLPEKQTSQKENFTLKWRQEKNTRPADSTLTLQTDPKKYQQKNDHKPLRDCCRQSGIIYRSYRQHVTNPDFSSFDKDSDQRPNYGLHLKSRSKQ